MSSKKVSTPVDAGNLGEVSALATALCEAEDAVEQAEQQLKILKERERKLREEDLPGAMEEVGLKKLTLANGAQISVGLEIYVSVPEHRKAAAYAWLEQHDFGGLIKTSLISSFGREEEEQERMRQVAELLAQSEVQFTAKQEVNAQTLKAWLREQLALGTEVPEDRRVPLDLFGARPVDCAKVKRPKA